MSRSEYSEEVAIKIDHQVREIALRCYQDAYRILNENRTLMDKLVELLLDQETIEGEQFRQIVTAHQAQTEQQLATQSSYVAAE